MLRKMSKICFCLSCGAIILAIFSYFSTEATLADNGTNFQVDVKEVLSVSITTPTSYASGDPGIFLREKISVSTSSNNTSGFVVGISAAKINGEYSTDLKNGSHLIPTLTEEFTCESPDPNANNGRCTNFTNDYWGYSINDSSAYNGTYKGVSSSVSEIFNSGTGASRVNTKTGDIYFGTKSTSAASGTYTGTVSIIAISGTTEINNDPPVNPANPEIPENIDDENATYIASPVDKTVYTTTDTNVEAGTKTEISQVSDGDNTMIYPLGEVEITTKKSSNTTITLVIVSLAIATTGFIFFIVAKRSEDDEDN